VAKKEIEGIIGFKERFLLKELLKYKRDPQIIALLGLRRTGKECNFISVNKKIFERKNSTKKNSLFFL
jgi:predicted AAA+ superfamily ATPase